MTQARNINCRQASRWLHARLDSALAPREEELLHVHWQGCPACAERARQLLAAVQALRSAPAPEPRVPLAARIRAAAAQALRESPAPAPRLRPAPAWAAAALAAALLIVAFTLHSPFSTRRAAPASSGAGAQVALLPPPPALSLPPATTPMVVAPAVAVTVPAVRDAVQADAGSHYHVTTVGMTRPARAPAPHPAYVSTRATMADTAAATPEDATESAAPVTDRVAAIGEEQPAPESTNSGDLANEVVSGLVVDAVLSTYLEGAPANVKVTPAVLSTENSE